MKALNYAKILKKMKRKSHAIYEVKSIFNENWGFA